MSAGSSSIRPTCRPHLYDSQTPGVSHKPKKFYLILNGHGAGCYTTWNDVAARVMGVSMANHASYKTYELAVNAWRAHCLSHHTHEAGFVDGTPHTPPADFEQPVATIPPPHISSVVHATEAAPNAEDQSGSHSETLSSISSPSIASTGSAPASPSKRRIAQAFFGPDSPSRVKHAPPRTRKWAVSSGGNNAVLTSEQADAVIEEARLRNLPVQVCEVDSVAEAAEWLERLDLLSEGMSTSSEVLKLSSSSHDKRKTESHLVYFLKFTPYQVTLLLIAISMSTQNANDAEARDPNTEIPPARVECSTSNDNPKSVPFGADPNTSINKCPESVSPPLPKNQKKKRGNKGNFHGDQLEYLEKELPGWLRLSRTEKSLWLTEFYSRWFKKFRWHITDCPTEFAALEPDLQTPADTSTESTQLSEEDLDALRKRRD
ncbi:hypothetical protein VKT23_010112 [Stygiomarasmius scandens]|uniref:Ribonuclease H1 N-terminal domain-containing protein n=1 Tax=Marasmiellus scandens TaxID=2682957 RepID=A0ABR1JC36_9AGAR